MNQSVLIQPHILQIKASATLAINERSRDLEDQGQMVYKLGFGQSPFPVPEVVVKALQAHAHVKDYLPVQGLVELRAAVAAWINTRTQLNFEDEDVMISPGSKELLFLSQLAFQGDLLLPSPSWVSYQPQALMVQKKVHWIDTTEQHGYKLLADQLESWCQHQLHGPALLLLNYPGNPSGTTYQQHELQALAEVLRKYQIIVLSDEIYGEVHHTGHHHSLATYYPEGTMISTGLSKWCGAGGWRLGTLVFPKALRLLKEAMIKMASETYTSASAPIQYAAIRAYVGGPDLDEYVSSSRQVLKRVGQYCHRRLSEMEVTSPQPEGGFYLMINFEKYRSMLRANGIIDSHTLCNQLLEQTGIALLPGVDFGRPKAELTARLSYVDFDGRIAQQQLSHPSFHKDEWLDAYVPKIVKAMDQLADWLLNMPGR